MNNQTNNRGANLISLYSIDYMSSKNSKKLPVNAPKPDIDTNAIKVNKTDATDDYTSVALKEETLRWLFSIISTLIIYWILAAVIQSIYHPDTDSLVKAAGKISYTGHFRPKPVESLLFRSAIVTIASGLLFFTIFFQKPPSPEP